MKQSAKSSIAKALGVGKPAMLATTSSGFSATDEYLRTVGALFAL